MRRTFNDDTGNTSSVSQTITVIPADTDGVDDGVDVCPGSVDDPAPNRLKRNRIWTESDLTDTFGCSASQIIEDAGLGAGHARFGISKSALAAWIASVS